MTPKQPALPLGPSKAGSERPARSSGAMVPCSFRVPAVMKAASLDLCDRMPNRFTCANDVYLAALRAFLEQVAHEVGDDKTLAALAPCRLVGDFEKMQQTVLEGVERTKEVVQAAVARGMGERAHEVYGAQVGHFESCGDNEWSKEGLRLLDANVKPLLPKRNPMNLRLLQRNSEK